MTETKRLTIAIDGHSSCGKSTLAKDLAKKLGYTYVDSGAMYRGIALFCLKQGLIENKQPKVELIEKILSNIELHFTLNSKTGTQDLFLNNVNVESEIRKPEIAAIVSPIAAISSVRHKLVDLQRKMGKKGGIVMDGRDIGSVVFPNADVKFFVTASDAVRAQRRHNELTQNGISSSIEDVLKNLIERDHIDSNRADSPLIQTEDSILLDNTNLNREQQLAFASAVIDKKLIELNLISNKC